MSPADVISFWRAAGPDRWFKSDPAFDAEIRHRFEGAWRSARDGELDELDQTASGMLALILLLDQFSRNMFRGEPEAFATDALARGLAQRMIANGSDMKVDPVLQQFVYMPLMHSENLADQARCVALFETTGDPNNIKHARIHADIIRRLGRFPHRNAVLGRRTTDQEAAFLDEGGFAG